MNISEFHVHVYFDLESRDSALRLRELLQKRVGDKLHYFGSLIDRPIGPHPIPMFEVNFRPEFFSDVVTFLMEHHGEHSILIHPIMGNDLLEHTEYAMWLGRQLPLKLEIF